MTCGVGCGLGSDPELLWLWRRPVATALIRPLAWEPPYAAGVALEKAKRPKKKKKKFYRDLKILLKIMFTWEVICSMNSCFLFYFFIFFFP